MVQDPEQGNILLEEWQRFVASALQGGLAPAAAAKAADRSMEELILRRGVLFAAAASEPEPTTQTTQE